MTGALAQRYFTFGGTRDTSTVARDKQFTGHQQEGDPTHHEGTDELYYMKARFYDPQVGRFLQPDTIVPDPMNPQSLNRYTYALNNPLRYTDPTGHQANPTEFAWWCMQYGTSCSTVPRLITYPGPAPVSRTPRL